MLSSGAPSELPALSPPVKGDHGWNIQLWQHLAIPCLASQVTSTFTGLNDHKPVLLRGYEHDLRQGRIWKILIYLIKSLDPLHSQLPFLPLSHDTSSLEYWTPRDYALKKLHTCPPQTPVPAWVSAKSPFLISFCDITTAITGMFISKEVII